MTTIKDPQSVAPSVRSPAAGPPSVQQIKDTIAGFTLQDRMTVFGAAALALLTFFNWFKLELPLELRAIVESSTAISGLVDAWGWLCLIFALALVAWHLVPAVRAAVEPKLPPNVIGWLPTALAGLAFFCGPVMFFIHSGDAPYGGRTIFFWAAFLAGAASVGGAVWKKVAFART